MHLIFTFPILLATLIATSESISDDETPFIPIENDDYSENEERPQPEGRAIGSVSSTPKPYQVYITISGEFRCSGSLVIVFDMQVVLSAARCFHVGYPKPFTLVSTDKVTIYFAPQQNDKIDLLKAKPVKPKMIMINEDYDQDYFTNDIAILFLESNVTIEKGQIEPIDMAEYGWDVPNVVTISGWGADHFGGEMSKMLREAEVHTIDLTECNAHDSTVTRRQFCVVGKTGRKGMCSRDVGGPATFRNNSKLYLYGILSYNIGYECGHPKIPTVITRVSEFYYWIKNEVFYGRP